jgi:hypothetical protein
LGKIDTVTQHAQWIDTLFNVSPNNILKKFKGYLFLSDRNGENSWVVKKISLKRGVLTFGSISGREEIQKLKEIAETAADTTSTHFNLTKSQFRKFVRQDGFGTEETFMRMSKNGSQ